MAGALGFVCWGLVFAPVSVGFACIALVWSEDCGASLGPCSGAQIDHYACKQCSIIFIPEKLVIIYSWINS